MATPEPSSSFSLTPSEVTFCKKLAENDGLNGQRAKALLTIHQGGTQTSAAQVSALTVGQVRYIVSRFRLHRIQALQTNIQTADTEVVESQAKAESKLKKKDKKAKAKSKDKAKKDKKDKKKSKSDKKKKKDKKKKSKK